MNRRPADYEMINGVPIIKCYKLPKNKYGTDNTNSYFRNDSDVVNIESASDAMNADVINILSQQTNFDFQDFKNKGGILFIYFSGSHKKFKDYSDTFTYPQMSPLRSRDYVITDERSVIDGFGVTAHQYGHIQFKWGHTKSGTCDIMNNGDVHDNNSPQFPNPIYRMLRGWLQPIAIETNQQLDSLLPIETSYNCGVITIFGKPSAAPDWSTGESFIVENRRRIGFDRKLLDKESSQQYPDFNGGLLIWHFSKNYTFPCESSTQCPYDSKIKFYPADGDTNLAQNKGNPRSFYAYKQGIDPFPINFYSLDSNKTYSGTNLPTGIKIDSIDQLNYTDLYSPIEFKLKYLISPPRQYSNVIYARERVDHIINYQDTVFYDSFDSLGYFNIAPGTIIESMAPKNALSTERLSFENLECKGTENSPIIFRGVGFSDQKTKVGGLSIKNPIIFQNIDSLILRNVIFENLSTFSFNNLTVENINQNYVSPIVELQNISIPKIYINSFPSSKVIFGKINLSNTKFILSTGIFEFKGGVNLTNDSVYFGEEFSTMLPFYGPEVFLNINNSIFLKKDSSIIFKDGAYLIANNVHFKPNNPTGMWGGIKLENSSIDSITNCTFTNSKTAITIINNQSTSNTNRVIKNNTFNIPSGIGYYKGIYGENNNNILIQNNTFNMPATSSSESLPYVGIYLKNTISQGVEVAAEEEGLPVTPYYLHLINNTFNNGSAGIILDNYISNFLPYYIKSNNFNTASTLNLLGRNINGLIKDNNFSSMNTRLGVHLITSSPDMYNNFIGAKDVSLHLIGHCYPNLALTISNGQITWRGGNNRLSTTNFDNIQLGVSGIPFTDWGHNRFTALDTSAYHIYGWVDTSVHQYYARDNCWYLDGNPKINLRRNASTPAIPTVTYTTAIDCSVEIDPGGWVVDYYGNGIYDSVMTTDDYSTYESTPEDDLLTQAEQYLYAPNYTDAITTYKYLIDNYPDFSKLPAAAQDLYSCYEYLDTTTDTEYRNTLYGNLKIYLADKLELDAYKGGDFWDVAYDLMLMCMANMGEYDDASNGYEFISLFHPDPDIRLNASWNYAEIQALFDTTAGGSGGGERQFQISNSKLQISNKEYYEINKNIEEELAFKMINRIINDDPIMRKLKEKYVKEKTQREEKIVKMVKESVTKNGGNIKSEDQLNEYIKKSTELDNMKYNKAKRNIMELKNLSPDEREIRRLDDLILSTRDFRNEITSDITGIVIPEDYKLHQNYPNPFNPTTKINFSIPKDGKVVLKIYDVSGKEVYTLVNEFKLAGNYNAIFNGSNLSSGVYFYRLNVGNFVESRRMILLK